MQNTPSVVPERCQASQVRRISSHGSEFMFKWWDTFNLSGQASAEQSFCQSKLLGLGT